MRISPSVAEKEVEDVLTEARRDIDEMLLDGVRTHSGVTMTVRRWDAIVTLLAEWREAREEIKRLEKALRGYCISEEHDAPLEPIEQGGEDG